MVGPGAPALSAAARPGRAGGVRLGHQSRVPQDVGRAGPGRPCRQLIADRLELAKVSMTQDRSLGRRAAGKQAADAWIGLVERRIETLTTPFPLGERRMILMSHEALGL